MRHKSQTEEHREGASVRGIVLLEHVNVRVPDQSLAALFFVSAMGFTRDPYVDFDDWNMWINVGRQQFHTPKGAAQVFRGEIGIRVPSLEELEMRLERLAPRFEATSFSFQRTGQALRITCPWGNRFICRAAEPGQIPMAIDRIDIAVPEGAIDGIEHAYKALLGCEVARTERSVEVRTEASQCLAFTTNDVPPQPYDGHHIAVYIHDFNEVRERLESEGLISEHSDEHQFRFVDFRDARTGETVWELEHEVRSLEHPMHGRKLVNRNPANTFFDYAREREALESLTRSSSHPQAN